jgi:drug/metabolite transporter (DMT)-like permease
MTSGNSRTEAASASSLRGFLLMLVAVTFWGGSASLAKYLILHRFDTLIITQTRSSLSFVLMALYFAVADRSVFRIRVRDIYKFVLLGVIGIAVTNFTYYYTAKESTVATAILVQYTAPVWVTLYAVLVSKEEHFNGLKGLSLLLALAGCYFAVTGGAGTAFHLPGWTALTGPGSAVTFAFLMIYTKRLSRNYRIWTMLIYMFGVAAVFWLFVNPPWQIAAHGYSASDWGVLWMFAVVSILIPHTAFTTSLKLLEASTVGIVGTLEPVIAIVVASVALNETLTGVQMLGAAGVVAAVLLLQWGRNRYLKLSRRNRRANGTTAGAA